MLLCIKTLDNLAQHCTIVTWRWQRWTFNKSLSKGKKHGIASQLL